MPAGDFCNSHGPKLNALRSEIAAVLLTPRLRTAFEDIFPWFKRESVNKPHADHHADRLHAEVENIHENHRGGDWLNRRLEWHAGTEG